jgi:tetratricopeptide (TPR) repeat protein
MMPEKLQAELKASLEAAAIPRCCDPALLAALLGVAPEESAHRLARLRGLNLVEPSPGDGEDAARVPEATRQVLRRILATVEPSRFRALSLRAAAFFRERSTLAARIDWIFHLLCGDPDSGAVELEKLDRDWTERGHTHERQLLAGALRELEDAGLAVGRARAWVLLSMAWVHESKGELAQWVKAAETALQAAREAGDGSAEAEALCLIGDARKAQGRFAEAGAAFEAFRDLGQRLAQQQPDNPGWQRHLTVAYSRLGETGWAQGQLETAEAAFGEGLEICGRMTKQCPGDTGWQRDLAVAYSKIGQVRREQGHLERARGAFAEYVAGFRRLVEQSPDHLGWQRELAIACGLLAAVRMALDGADTALPYYEESSRLLAKVVEQAPGVAQWRQDRRLIDEELAACRKSLGMQRRVKSGLSWLQDKLPF